jgi:hypothetical protein
MSKTLGSVIGRLVDREVEGTQKYGTTVDRADLSPVAWAVHLHEELMDACLYLERLRYALLLMRKAKLIINECDHPKAAEWMREFRIQFGEMGE